MATRVVLEQTVLNGSVDSGIIQRVATVYIDGEEYRVSAPPKAKGPALDWLDHFSVRQWDDLGSGADVEVHDWPREAVMEAVKAELESHRTVAGLHPDGVHYAAQICEKGHVQHCDGAQFDSNAYCTKCGAVCVDRCRGCDETIRGVEQYRPVDTYERPQYCHRCGRAYPWMEDRLRTARALLGMDAKLTAADRDELFELLQEVMRDPKSPLVPAKRRILEGKLDKVTEWVRVLILDLTAKTIAEMSKS